MVITKQKQNQCSTTFQLDIYKPEEGLYTCISSIHVPEEGLYISSQNIVLHWLCFCFVFTITLIKHNAMNILKHKRDQVSLEKIKCCSLVSAFVKILPWYLIILSYFLTSSSNCDPPGFPPLVLRVSNICRNEGRSTISCYDWTLPKQGSGIQTNPPPPFPAQLYHVRVELSLINLFR